MDLKSELLKLCESPVTKKIRYCPSSKCFFFGEKRLKGITKNLKKCFWSNYQYQYNKSFGIKTGVRNKYEGLARGSSIHKQLDDYFSMPLDEFCKVYKNVHSYTFNAIEALNKNKIKPLLSEFPISEANQNFATNVDLLACKTNTKELCLVEWKSGMDNYLTQSSGYMKGPYLLKTYNNCPLHQAFIQAIIMQQMIEETYDIIIKHIFVGVTNEQGAILYPIPNELYEKRTNIYKYFKKFIENKKNSKGKK